MRVRVASAGTGKTTSLVVRYLQLVDEGRPLRRIAGVTFTRAAADELRQRVGAGIEEVLETGGYLGPLFRPRGGREAFEQARRELGGAVLSTIHGFMIAALRLCAPALGLDPDFGVLGEWEASAMFEEEARGLMLLAADPAHPRHRAAALLGEPALELLRELFARRSLAAELEAGPAREEAALVELFADAYRRYLARLGGALSAPGEVERRALMALEAPQARARLAARFPLALIDEFQDVNPTQGAFFERLEGAGVQLEVVGDPKQSIYGFRNADVEVFRRALDAAERAGEALPPLVRTRRHAAAVASFLNRLTEALAARSLGFGPREAPAVEPAGEQAERTGRVELHWVVGEDRMAELRSREAGVLAAALAAAQDRGTAFDDMAVLARGHGSLAAAERGLRSAGIPCVMLQGRGYYERPEIRDLYHALRVGIRPEGLSLAAFLRGPFGRLSLAEVDAVMAAQRPLEALAERRREVAGRLEAVARLARLAPLEALKGLIRDELADGRRFVDVLDERARQNVDALLFEVAAGPPRDLETLLERLQLLSRQADAGDVPQSGAGVKLLTVHRSKGLEFAVAALFDAGRMPPPRSEGLYLDPADGRVRLPGSEGYREARAAGWQREEQESYRLLYVALSRARDEVIVTGSVKAGRPQGWAAALATAGLGPGRAVEGVDIVTHRARELAPSATAEAPRSARQLPAAPWLGRRFLHHRHPPVFSPSRLKAGASPEPRPPSDPGVEDGAPGRAAAIGTLVHYAIGQDWRPGDAGTHANLVAQEVMFAFSPEEREEIMGEVLDLLRRYRSMLGAALPGLAARRHDRSELPVAVPYGGTVWQGVIDRLYQAGGRWVVEDYKTDAEVRPERYAFQLALYAHAVERALGERPLARLAFLRPREVVELDDAALAAALAEAAEGRGS